MLNFKLDIWDYITFGALVLALGAVFATVLFLAGLPGRIAIARKHPDAEAVGLLGWAGFIPVVPWIQAFIWAFKPTQVIDVRRFPKQQDESIDVEIAKLSHKPIPVESNTPPSEEEIAIDKKGGNNP